MRRKIIPHGPSSLTISLPSHWVKRHNLKKGEELDVYEEDNHLMVKPICMSNLPKKTEVSFIGLDQDIWKDMILTLHRKGYDEVKINIDKQDTIKELHSFLNSMQLGFEIIKQEQNSIFVKNISNPEGEEFDTLFRRLFWIAIEYTNRIDSIINKQEDITHSILLHENSICRISNYCRRIIVKERKSDSPFLYSILKDMNTIAQSLTLLLNELKERNGNTSKQFKARYKETGELFSQINDLYYKFSINEYSSAKKQLESLEKEITKSKSESTEEQGYWDILNSITNGTKSMLESILVVHS
jgi:phosphate uptake regulator